MKRDEDRHQKATVRYCRLKNIPVIHIANERKCSAQQGKHLKDLGVVAGCSDLFFPRPNANFKDMWIEMKSKDGRVSKAQADFLRDRIEEGSCGHIAYSVEEALIMINDFYSIKAQ